MNKLLTKIVGVALGATMAVGVGLAAAKGVDSTMQRADAAETLFKTCDLSAKTAKNTSYGTEWTYGDFKIFGGANNNGSWAYVTFGSKKAKASDDPVITNAYVKTSSALSAAISKVSFTVTTARKNNGTVNISLDVASDASFTSIDDTVTFGVVDQTVEDTYDITPTSGTSWTANRYYRLNITCSNDSTNNGMFSMTNISYFFEPSPSASYTVTYDANGGSGEMADSTGASITLPSCGFTAPEGYAFKEWNTQADGNGTSYSVGTVVTEDLDLYAIWYDPDAQYKFTGDTVTFANQGLEDTIKYPNPFHSEVFSVQFGDGANDGKYYNTGSGIRTYNGGGKIYLNALAGKFTSIEFTWDSSNKPSSGNFTLSSGTLDGTYSVWTGDSKTVTLTNTATGSGHWRLQSITVTTVVAMEVIDVNYAAASSFDVTKGDDIVLYGHEIGAPAQTVLSGLSWNIDDTSVATIDGGTNYCTVTGVSTGNTTLTMSKTGYDDVEVEIVCSNGEITLIVVSGTLSKSDYYVGDAWSHDGLTVTGVYESLDETDLTNQVTWTYTANGVASEAASLGDTSLVATAHYGELSDSSTSKAITVSVAPTVDYTLYQEALTEGDYIIFYGDRAMKNTISSDKFSYEDVTPTDDVISTADESIVWHIAQSGSYWTIYNAGVAKYAAGNGTKNQGTLLDDGSDDKALWTVTGTTSFEFVNKYNSDHSVNANLRNNTTYGFACYSTGTGGALSLYKKNYTPSTKTCTSISITSNPTKTTYSAGEHLDLTGLVVVANWSDGSDPTVISSSEYTTSPTTSAELTTDINEVTVSYTYGDDTRTASFSIVVNAYVGKTYNLINETAGLHVGDKVVIASSSYDKAMAGQTANNRSAAEITKTSSTLTSSATTVEFTVVAGTTEGTFGFYDANEDGYLCAASSSNNYLRTEATLSENSSFAVTISDGVASIVAQGNYSRKVMQYNNGSSIFACYGSATQSSVALYKLPYSAADFAKDLLKMTKDLCNSSYAGQDNHDALAAIWSTLSGTNYWQRLDDKTSIISGAADSTIEVPTTDSAIDAMSASDAIGAALYRYDFCTVKYNLTDFISRTSGSNRINPIAANNTALIIIVATISVISVSALGAYFLLRKKKEER